MTSTAISGLGAFAGFAMVCGFAVTILWLIIGWRAASAHERIAAALEKLARQQEKPQ
jgi:hypothetical protein